MATKFKCPACGSDQIERRAILQFSSDDGYQLDIGEAFHECAKCKIEIPLLKGASLHDVDRWCEKNCKPPGPPEVKAEPLDYMCRCPGCSRAIVTKTFGPRKCICNKEFTIVA